MNRKNITYIISLLALTVLALPVMAVVTGTGSNTNGGLNEPLLNVNVTTAESALDQTRAQLEQKIRERADLVNQKTSLLKSMVADYKRATEEARTANQTIRKTTNDAYRAAVKQATDTFQAALKAATEARKTSMKTANDTMRAAVKTAEDAYKASIKAAADKMKLDRQTLATTDKTIREMDKIIKQLQAAIKILEKDNNP